MLSKITGGPTKRIFVARVLNKYDVAYFQCEETGFIQTEEPYWLEEAYANAITILDLGCVQRNLSCCPVTAAIIDGYFERDEDFVDFGGGYGLFVRLMRDAGFRFYRDDLYCENLFARMFDWPPPRETSSSQPKAELLTAWEVFEHLVNPAQTLTAMLELSDSVLFSTLLVPHGKISDASDWWYFTPETGQHVAFYTLPALQYLAKSHGAQLFSDGVTLHLMTRRRDMSNPFKSRLMWKIRLKMTKLKLALGGFSGDRRSLLQSDFDLVRRSL